LPQPGEAAQRQRPRHCGLQLPRAQLLQVGQGSERGPGEASAANDGQPGEQRQAGQRGLRAAGGKAASRGQLWRSGEGKDALELTSAGSA
jgi:hypothetical protein